METHHPPDDEVVAAYLAGDKTKDILDRFGISRSSLYWILHRNDIQPSRQKRNEVVPRPVEGGWLDQEQVLWFAESTTELRSMVEDLSVTAAGNRQQLAELRVELTALRALLGQAVTRQDVELKNQASILSLLTTLVGRQ